MTKLRSYKSRKIIYNKNYDKLHIIKSISNMIIDKLKSFHLQERAINLSIKLKIDI